MPNDIPSFVKWIVNQRPEAAQIPEEEKAIMEKNLAANLERTVNVALLAEMTPEQIEQFNQVADHGSEAEIQQFVEHGIPNSQEIMTKVLSDFAKMYLGDGDARTATAGA